MVPKTLQEWSLEQITDLLTIHYMEQETFDWKQMLPHSKDEEGKTRLRKECCAFANSNGGFLIFGVHDDSRLPAKNRLVGLDPQIDFPVQFGNYPIECNPSVRWEPKNPALSLPNGNLIHVVWIPRSWNAPHSIGKAEEGFVFPKRTNRGIEHMNYEEVRMFFLGYYEKRMKLQLLFAELVTIKKDAKAMIPPEDQWEFRHALDALHLQVLEAVLVDAFSILQESTSLVVSLMAIRSQARSMNARVDYVRPIAYHASYADASATAELRRQNECLSHSAEDLVKEVDTAIQLLKELLSK